MPKPIANEVRRLSKADWIDGAILYLSHHSVDSLRLDVLARQFGVTKGSFYWHFTSREQLLEAVLDTWRQRNTRDIAAWLDAAAGTPKDQLKQLIHIGISARFDVAGGPLELTLRDWGRRDERVRTIIDDVDRERLDIVRILYLRAGLDAEGADAFALTHMAYVIGGHMMLFDGSPELVARRRAVAERLLLSSPTGPKERS